MRPFDFLPGLMLLALVGGVGWALGTVGPVPALVAAVAAGALLGNAVGYPARFAAGVRTHKLWLETGIVLMGAGISLDAVVAAGPPVLVLVVGVVTATVLFVELLARGALSVPPRFASLLAAGAGVCGVSAVVSVAGGIDADESHVAYASAAVVAFDAVTLVVYPAVGRLLSLSDAAFGVWAGATMFSTGPVTAAGFAYSTTAGQWAVLVKLARNALIGPLTVGYAMYYARSGEAVGGRGGTDRGLRAVVGDVPPFVVGFLLLVVAGNTVLSPAAVTTLESLSGALFLLAFAGLGLELRLSQLRAAGVTPLAVLAVSLVAASGATLLAVTLLF